MLYTKTITCFEALAPEQQKELTHYVFATLFTVCDNELKAVVSKIASICATIACYSIDSNWKEFLDHLTEAMKASPAHVRAGLLVLEEIPCQCKELRDRNYMEKNYVRRLFMQKGEHLMNVFVSVFRTGEQQNITKTLECLDSWAEFGLTLMENPDLVKEMLLQCNVSFENFDFATEAFAHSFKYQCYNNHWKLEEDANTPKEQLSETYLQSIVSLVQFILSHKDPFMQDTNSEYLYMYGFLIKELLLFHPWIVPEDPIHVATPLL